jgi:hypothetical protein
MEIQSFVLAERIERGHDGRHTLHHAALACLYAKAGTAFPAGYTLPLLLTAASASREVMPERREGWPCPRRPPALRWGLFIPLSSRRSVPCSNSFYKASSRSRWSSSRSSSREWPATESGPVADSPGETWCGIDNALEKGRRGLPGGDSVAALLARHGRKTYRGRRAGR